MTQPATPHEPVPETAVSPGDVASHRGSAATTSAEIAAVQVDQATPCPEPAESGVALAQALLDVPLPEGGTLPMSAADVVALRAQAALPFAQAPGPGAAPAAPGDDAPRQPDTASMRGVQAAALRSQAVLPFKQAAAPGSQTLLSETGNPHHGGPAAKSDNEVTPLRSRAGTPVSGGDRIGAPTHTAHDETRAVRVIADGPLQVATLSHQIGPARRDLVVVAKATCDLFVEGHVGLREAARAPTGDVEHVPGGSLRYPSDFAAYKPRADVVLHGHAYPPRGDESASFACFAFGCRPNRFERGIAVFGDRQWHQPGRALVPSAPLPFGAMPLTYERAFGGHGFRPNPIGMGHRALAGTRGVAALPNLEDPAALIRSPSDEPPPACFGPVAPRWSCPERFDESWRRTGWPLFPRGFDFRDFQCAPPSQQLDYLRGDEPFACVGMDPHHHRIVGQLPGVTARCFVAWRDRSRGDFGEVRMRLDTVVFDLDYRTIELVWRGAVEITDPACADVAGLYVASEMLGGSRMSLHDAKWRWLAEQ